MRRVVGNEEAKYRIDDNDVILVEAWLATWAGVNADAILAVENKIADIMVVAAFPHFILLIRPSKSFYEWKSVRIGGGRPRVAIALAVRNNKVEMS
mmetsp:Transcript_27210/g.44987  ORF Transcript_27210/g.44987 Transcript_27210/m.44987 type:complete len:96 (-) Transcript_27210:202-489(-)